MFTLLILAIACGGWRIAAAAVAVAVVRNIPQRNEDMIFF